MNTTLINTDTNSTNSRIGRRFESLLGLADAMMRVPCADEHLFLDIEISCRGGLQLTWQATDLELGSVECFCPGGATTYHLESRTLRQVLEGNTAARADLDDLDAAVGWIVGEMMRLAEIPRLWPHDVIAAASESLRQ